MEKTSWVVYRRALQSKISRKKQAIRSIPNIEEETNFLQDYVAHTIDKSTNVVRIKDGTGWSPTVEKQWRVWWG